MILTGTRSRQNFKLKACSRCGRPQLAVSAPAMALYEAWNMPGPVAGNSDSVVPAGCPEDLWIKYCDELCVCNAG